MKLRLFLLGILVVGSAAAAPKPKGRTAAAPAPSGPARVAPAKRDPRCPASSATTTRWASARGPLALVTREGIRSADACCEAFARDGSTWLAVDALGHAVGEARLSRGATCHELSFAKTAGASGVGLFVERVGTEPITFPEAPPAPPSPNGRVTYVPPAFAPSKEAVLHLNELYDELTVQMTAPPASPCAQKDDERLPLAKRSLFFQQAPAAHEDDPEPLVVVGGHVLIIASPARKALWQVEHVEAAGADRCRPRAYRPLAAVDMDADGAAELVVSAELGGAHEEIVLALDRRGAAPRWREAARASDAAAP